MNRIQLTDAEREELHGIVRRGQDGRQVRRAQALVWVEDGEAVGAVAARLGVSRQAVWHWMRRWRYREGRGVTHTLADSPRSGRPATQRQRVAALVPGLVERSPRLLDYRFGAWSVPLLHQHLQRAQGLRVSQTTIRRALRGLGYRYKRPRYVLARRSPTWRQAKGG